jgi:DNA invertase Pin-like site-specific DNA recombinase
MKAIGYVRVSTQEQVEGGVSLDNQESKIKAYAICKDIDLVEIIQDPGCSAKDLIHRAGIQRVINLVKTKEIDAVVIYKLDRLTRSVKDLGYLIEIFEKSEVDLMSVQDSIDTSTAAGRLVLNVMGSVAQWEREVIGERTGEALAYKKANNQVYGEIPYGYRKEGESLVMDSGEQENIKLMKSLREQGHSYRQIAKKLEQEGILTKKGLTKWNHKTVKCILMAA